MPPTCLLQNTLHSEALGASVSSQPHQEREEKNEGPDKADVSPITSVSIYHLLCFFPFAFFFFFLTWNQTRASY